MARNVYITAMEPQSGKSVVALGLMELLSARTGSVGFFRPLVGSEGERDTQIELIRTRYALDSDPEEMYALTDVEAQAHLAAGARDEVEKRVVSAYRDLERRFDVMVCEGTDFAGTAPALDFDLNASLANGLGCPVLAVVVADSPDAAEAAVGVARESLESRGCELFGVVVEPRAGRPCGGGARAGARSRRRHRRSTSLAEEPSLERPTVGEVAAALGRAPGLGRRRRAESRGGRRASRRDERGAFRGRRR